MRPCVPSLPAALRFQPAAPARLQVTPTTVPLLRAFANEVVLDVLFYEQEAHRRRRH